jgi:hypothetical protein
LKIWDIITDYRKLQQPITTMARQPLIDDTVLRAALVGLEQRKAETERQIATVRQQLGGAGNTATPAAPARKKRTMSAAARKRIGEATRLRWEAFRKAKTAGK